MSKAAVALPTKATNFSPHPHGILQRKCACGTHTMGGGQCAECNKTKQRLQRMVLSPNERQNQDAGEVSPIVHEVLRSPGQPLDDETRAFFESRFGHDFSHVRVHADGKATKSAEAVGALAYTAGRSVVFAAGQYVPTSEGGRRLLAHELAHVVQGGLSPQVPTGLAGISHPGDPSELEADRTASSVIDKRLDHRSSERLVMPRGIQSDLLIHRIPAPPSYNAVTGTIDMTKVRFTPVPDFKLGDLTSPLILTPTLADRSLVHLSWELYDPADALIDGFSTLPGRSTSRTESFSLRPDLFRAGKAVTGRYTVRLVGRNAAHEPVAYFERYFFALAADLKTGTPSSNGFGEFAFTEYGKTDGDFSKGTDYVVDIKMKFMPKVDAVTCDQIAFLQVLESSDKQGMSNHRFAGARKEARKTPLNYSVDRAESGPSPFYGTFKDPTTKKIEPSGTTFKPGKGGRAPVGAELEDHPSWSQVTVDRFETCATCRAGSNVGQVYGCVTWGFSVDSTGKVTLMPRSYNTAASDTLKPAVTKWNTWRTAQATPGEFEAAPSLK